MSAGMTAADLRSLVGDIRGKLGSDPAVVALIAEGEGGSVPVRDRRQPGRPGPGPPGQRLGQAARRSRRRSGRRQGRPRAGLGQGLVGHRRRARRGASRDSAGQLSGLFAPPAGSARRGRSRTRAAARHRCGQCAHRRGVQRPGRHLGHAGGNGPPRPVGQASATAGRAGRRAARGRGCRRAAANPGRPHRPVGPRRDRAGRARWPAGSRRYRCGWPTSG